MDWTYALAYAGIGHPFAPACPVSRRLALGWPVGPPAGPGAPGRHGTRHGRGRYGARQSVAELSWDQAVRDHLLEDATRGHGDSVIVAAINRAKLPASTAAVETLKEAVPRATACVCLDGVGAILLE